MSSALHQHVAAAVAGLALLVAGTASALFEGDNQPTDPTGTVQTAARILACILVKTSYKGENEGFFSSAEKSVEAQCQDRDGELIEFSATMAQWQTLLDHAGRQVLIYLSDQKIPNAKTDWSLIEPKAIDTQSYRLEKLCGPPQGQQLLQDKKVWSRGFRVAQSHEAVRYQETWQLQTYVGLVGDTHWTEKGRVELGDYCKASIYKIMAANSPLIYTYVQPDDDPDYLVEAVYRLVPGR